MKPRMSTIAAAAALALAGSAHALQRLDEQQMSEVRGRAPIDARQLYANFVGPWLQLSQQPLPPGQQQGPQTYSFEATQWLGLFGLHYDGPSMGTFSLQNVDTSGLSVSLQWHR